MFIIIIILLPSYSVRLYCGRTKYLEYTTYLNKTEKMKKKNSRKGGITTAFEPKCVYNNWENLLVNTLGSTGILYVK